MVLSGLMVYCKGLYFKAVVCNAGLEVAVKVLGLAFNGPASGRLGKLGFKVACDMVFTCRFVAKRLARYDAGAVIVTWFRFLCVPLPQVCSESSDILPQQQQQQQQQ